MVTPRLVVLALLAGAGLGTMFIVALIGTWRGLPGATLAWRIALTVLETAGFAATLVLVSERR